MKKLAFTLILLALLAEAALFAWEPSDLATFPSVTQDKEWQLNLGMGFAYVPNIGEDYLWIPPLHLAADRNTAIGGLPFFFGGSFGYSGYGVRLNNTFFSTISMGIRIGYHFNWGVDKLDTYLVSKWGGLIYPGDEKARLNPGKTLGRFLWGVNIGARFYPLSWLGFWAEIGYSTFSFLDFGITIKF